MNPWPLRCERIRTNLEPLAGRGFRITRTCTAEVPCTTSSRHLDAGFHERSDTHGQAMAEAGFGNSITVGRHAAVRPTGNACHADVSYRDPAARGGEPKRPPFTRAYADFRRRTNDRCQRWPRQVGITSSRNRVVDRRMSPATLSTRYGLV